jgi:hypothetical protein
MAWSNVRQSYEMIRKGTTRAWALTGSAWSLGNHSGAGRILFPLGAVFGGVGASSVDVKSATNLAAITGSVTAGTIWLYSAPAAGGRIGVVCTTSGTVGSSAVLKEFGAIDA